MADLSADIVVLGAGILGLSVAAELTARAHVVHLVDPGGPNASSVAAGMIAPAFESLLDQADPERAALLRDAAGLWPAFADRHGLTLDPRPALWRGPDAERVAECLRELRFRTVSEPGGVAAPDDVRIDVDPALEILRGTLHHQGVVGRADTVEVGGDGVLVRLPTVSITARAIVLATGAEPALGGLDPAARQAMANVRPIAGQIGVVDERLTERVLRGPEGYVVPGASGTLIGATMVEGRSTATVDAEASARLIDMAERLLGRPLPATVRWRAGVRGASPDALPLAGPVGTGVHLALAPRRNGWLLAPLVARTVADGIEGRPCEGHGAALDPLRFNREAG